MPPFVGVKPDSSLKHLGIIRLTETQMTHATIRKDGKVFVLVPKSEYRRLTSDDRRDARKAQQALAKLRAGKLRTIRHETLKRQLGL